ncbi:hypothetical protein CerSpe_209760 [Prunus speciosa]
MAPENAIQGIVTSKVDIYNYGVVMLEIVSGKKNTGYNFNHESISWTWLMLHIKMEASWTWWIKICLAFMMQNKPSPS